MIGRSQHWAEATAGGHGARPGQLAMVFGLVLALAVLLLLAPVLRAPARERQPLLPGLTLEDLGPQKGVIVTSIQRDSPALIAGIAVGDRIVALDQDRVGSITDVRRYVGPHHPMAVDMRLVRGDKLIDLTYAFPSEAAP